MAASKKNKEKLTVIEHSRYCSGCHKDKTTRYFYKSNSPRFDNEIYWGHTELCKECLKDKVYRKDGQLDKGKFIESLKTDFDMPFFNEKYMLALNSGKEVVGEYLRLLNLGTKKNKQLTWKDGETEEKQNKVKIANKKGLIDVSDLSELTLKWGDEWNEEELLLLEQTYKELGADKNMKYNSSKQYLKLATMNYVRSYTAMKQGNVQDAEKYTKLFNETMKMGEFNPSALSKNSNLEKLGSFCDFSLMVEECLDVIDLQKILPEYMQQPRDLADKVIWYVVNYMQDSQGYKMSSYEDIYKFYTKMEEDYFGIPASQIPRSSISNDTLDIEEEDNNEDEK
jgi:hypothetical protein